jgi:hypothetical protein
MQSFVGPDNSCKNCIFCMTLIQFNTFFIDLQTLVEKFKLNQKFEMD